MGPEAILGSINGNGGGFLRLFCWTLNDFPFEYTFDDGLNALKRSLRVRAGGI